MSFLYKNHDKPCLIFIYGFPAAGKTTLAHRLFDDFKKNMAIELISADEVRRELYGSPDRFGIPIEVYEAILSKMLKALKSGVTVIYDGTNLRKDYRMNYLDALQDVDCYKYIIRVNTTKERCIKNHESRGRNIPPSKSSSLL